MSNKAWISKQNKVQNNNWSTNRSINQSIDDSINQSSVVTCALRVYLLPLTNWAAPLPTFPGTRAWTWEIQQKCIHRTKCRCECCIPWCPAAVPERDTTKSRPRACRAATVNRIHEPVRNRPLSECPDDSAVSWRSSSRDGRSSCREDASLLPVIA